MAQLDDDLNALFASSGAPPQQQAAPQPQRLSFLQSILAAPFPQSVVQGTLAKYAAMPKQIQDDQTSRALDLQQKRAALSFMLQRRDMLAQLLPQLMGQPGPAPAQQDGGPALPPLAPPQGQPPQGQPQDMPGVTPVAPVTIPAPKRPQADPLALRRQALAGLAVVDDKPSDAWSILKGDFAPGVGGDLYDKTNGQPNGVRMPVPQVVNDRIEDVGDPQNVGQFFGKPPAPGAEPVYDRQGREVGWHMGDGSIQAIQQSKQADATGQGAGQAAYAGTIAGSQARAEAPYKPVIVSPDSTAFSASQLPGAGSVGGPAPPPVSGLGMAARPPQRPASTGTSPAPAVVPGPVPRGPAGGIVGQNPGDVEFSKNQGSEASKTITADIAARTPALQQYANARQALAYVQAHGNAMNPTLPFQVAGANYLRSLPPAMLKAVGVDPNNINATANDAAVYQRLSSQDLLSFSKTNLPSRYTEREMAVAGKVIPQLTTAPDAASFHWGLEAATANKAMARAQFSAGYSGPKTAQGIEQAWTNSRDGQASLFQDPVWQNIQISGKPAVVQFQHNGQTWGAVGSGTGHPTFFKWVN